MLPIALSELPKALVVCPKALIALPKALCVLPKALLELPKALSAPPIELSELPRASWEGTGRVGVSNYEFEELARQTQSEPLLPPAITPIHQPRLDSYTLEMAYGKSGAWSNSRSRSFKECRRRYFFEYFPYDHKDTDQIWSFLKPLTTVDMLVGTVVDNALSAGLKRFSKTGELPADMLDRGTDHFRKLLKSSQELVSAAHDKGHAFSFDDRPLIEHYYQRELPSLKIQECEGVLRTCLRNFQDSQLLERIKTVQPSDWGVIRNPADLPPHFKLENITVYAAYDFYFREGDSLYIVDWKTSRRTTEAEESAAEQLSVYALFGVTELKHPRERVYVQPAWLREPVYWEPEQVSQDDIDACAQKIRSDHSEQMNLCSEEMDGSGKRIYISERDQFPAQPSKFNCWTCKFLQICPDGQSYLVNAATDSSD
jgi:hypothetical protein